MLQFHHAPYDRTCKLECIAKTLVGCAHICILAWGSAEAGGKLQTEAYKMPPSTSDSDLDLDVDVDIDVDNYPLLDKQLPVEREQRAPLRAFLRAFWPLPLIAFGGPHACVALLFATFVDGPVRAGAPRVSEAKFLELYALSQSLPGPNSTKMAALLGATFGGSRGAAYATALWLLPGFLAMSTAGALFHAHRGNEDSARVIAYASKYAVGLVAAAFSFVLIAAFKLVQKIVGNDRAKAAITTLASAIAVLAPPRHLSWICVVLLAVGGTSYFVLESARSPSGNVSDITRESDDDEEAGDITKDQSNGDIEELDIPISKTEGIIFLIVVASITAILFLPPRTGEISSALHLARVFWRIGLCVYGGALVIVPLLLTEFVNGGLLPANIFLAAFGLFGCIPGPMVNLVAFIGSSVLGFPGALLGAVAVNSPGIMLQLGLVPFWTCIRRFDAAQTFLQGANSAAAGLIVAGVWMLLDRAITGPAAFVMTVSAGCMGVAFKAPMPLIVVVHGIIGGALHYFGIGMHRAATV